MNNRKMLIPIAAIALIGAGVYGVSQVSAASTGASGTTLVEKISNTFHLDKAQVQAVFDQDRSERQAQRETDYEKRLAQAVTDGKLTSAQKDAILAKHKELAAKLEAAKDKTDSERRTLMDQIRQETKDWATQNNIDAKWLMMGGGRGHGGFGGGHPADISA